MFAYITDFQLSTAYLEPIQVVELLNEAVNIFDNITDKFDVFKVKTKLDANYMIVAGLHDRSNTVSDEFGSLMVENIITKIG